jgi:aspartate/methionine/tyrosine aminotransferase
MSGSVRSCIADAGGRAVKQNKGKKNRPRQIGLSWEKAVHSMAGARAVGVDTLSFPGSARGLDPAPVGAEVSYARWVRNVLKAAAAQPDAAVLFDSTIREPTSLLADVVRRAFANGVTDRYESVFSEGNRFVTAAVAKRYGVTPTQVIGATGATSAMGLVLRAFVRPGDHVIVEQPVFDLLPTLAQEAGAVLSFIPRRAPDFSIDTLELAGLIRPDTRLIILTQAHNPTGGILDKATLAAAAAVAHAAGIPILIDEVYADFLGADVSALRVADDFISVGSLTKVQGLFALRCGWAVASPKNIAKIQAATPQGDLGVSKLSHAIAALVLENMAPFDAHWRGLLAQARPVVEHRARQMVEAGLLAGKVPELGCMYFPQVVGVADTRALADWLWARHRIVVAPGEFFGQAGHIRIGFGGDAAHLDRGLERLHAALAEYSRER